jgi:hypothetical protein
VALAVVLTWPLLPHLATHVPGTDLDDNAGFLWDFWLFRQALADPSADVLSTTAVFHPEGINLALHTHLLLSAFFGGTLLGWTSLPVALNLSLLAAGALNGFSTYLLAYRLTAHRAGALVAGVFFAASPFFAVHFLGHFNRYTAWPLVFFVHASLIAFERMSMRTAIVAGAWLAAVAYVDYYYFVYALVFAATALVCQWSGLDLVPRTAHRSRTDLVLLVLAATAAGVAVLIHVSGGPAWTLGPVRVSLRCGTNVRAVAAGLSLWWLWRRRRWTPVAAGADPMSPAAAFRAVALLLGTCLLLLAPILTRALAMWRDGQYVTQAYVWRNAPPGIDVGALLTGNPLNTWWGSAVARFDGRLGIDTLAPQLWLGIVPLVLLFTSRSWMAERAARTWVLFGAVFFIWSAGPFLRVFGVDTGLPLPQILLRYVPVVSNARLPPHAAVLVYLAVAVLLAYALAKWRFGRARLAAFALGGLIVLDFIAAPRPIVALEQAPIFDRLAQRPAGAVLDVPTGIRDGFGPEGRFDAAALYRQTRHRKPIVTGYVSRLPPAVRQRYHNSPAMRALFALSSETPVPAGAADPAAAATELSSRWQVRYIVVDRRNAPDAAQRFVEAMGAPLVDRDEFRRVYELRQP